MVSRRNDLFKFSVTLQYLKNTNKISQKKMLQLIFVLNFKDTKSNNDPN